MPPRHHTTLRAVLERVPHHFLKRWITTTMPFRMRRAMCSGSGPQVRIQRETGTRTIPHLRGVKRIITVDTNSAEKSSTRPGKSALLTCTTPMATAKQAATMTASAWGYGRTGSRRPARTGSGREPIRRGMLQKTGIDRKISSHKSRHRYAANLRNAGVELVDIQALLGHSTLNTTPIDAYVD